VRAVDAPGSIEDLIVRESAPLLVLAGLKLLAVEVGAGGGDRRVRVVIDRPDGAVTTVDCEWLSERLGLVLDAKSPMAGRYYLEVSSPGIERPLLGRDDFDRFSGRTAAIATAAPVGGRRHFTGVLRGVAGDCVEIEAGGERLSIPLAAVARARLKVGTDELFGRTAAKPRRKAKRPAKRARRRAGRGGRLQGGSG